MENGVLRNRLVDKDEMQFPLKGMLCPTFQNQGTAEVIVNGRVMATDESYTINVPGVVLQNTIQISFEDDPAKTRILYVGYVELTK